MAPKRRQIDLARAIASYRLGATLNEIAAEEQTSPATVKRRLEEARETIRDHRGSKSESTRLRISLARRAAIPEDRLRELHAQGTTTREMAAQLPPWSEEAVRHAQKRLGLARLPGKARMTHNYFWAGGLIVDKGGYILQKVIGHPQASKKGYIRQHRLVMEARLERMLGRSEVVDHRNRDTSDNRFENLCLYPSNAEHLRATVTGRPNLPAAEREHLRLEAVRRGRERIAAILEERGTDAGPLPLPDGHPLSRSPIGPPSP
jgi:transposase